MNPREKHLVSIETGTTRKESVELKETPRHFSEDGSLLMRWHETDVLPNENPRQFHYATAIMPGYTGVRNLEPGAAWELFDYKNKPESSRERIGQYIDRSSPTMLLPLQGGICPYDCEGCPFAAHAEGHEGKKTKELGTAEIESLIEQSLQVAKEFGIKGKKIGIAFVGSGDATPNPNLKEILLMIAKEYGNKISRVRVSTIAGMVYGEHRTPMQVVKEIYSGFEYAGAPIINVQVSAHNTNEQKRALHVFHQRPDKEGESVEQRADRLRKNLLPLNEVAKQFQELVDAQQGKGLSQIRKPTLTFVCTQSTELEVGSLKEFGFNPNNTVIQLRPILSDNPADRMSEKEFKRIYEALLAENFDVVIMPVSPSAVELEAG